MKVQTCLLSTAIATALAIAAPASAAQRAPGHDAAVARAKSLLAGRRVATAAQAASADQFVAESTVVDADGTEHVRFARTYQGLRMIGGDLVVHSRNGESLGVSQTLHTTARPGVQPKISTSRAIGNAKKEFAGKTTEAPGSNLVVYARGAKPVLAYEVVLQGFRADQTPREMHYFVDAKNGTVLDRWDGVETAKPGRDGDACSGGTAAVGSGKSLTEGDVALDTVKCGSVYQLRDLTSGGGYTTNMGLRQTGMGSVYVDADNKWGNGGLNDSATVAADAHYGVSATWDYYLDVHGRHGIANDGVGAASRVHYGRNYGNAFWRDSCFCMTFGDGDNGVSIMPLVALDIAGHEMSHGVTSRSADLDYSGESGGLNESNSDIMGTMVEWHVNNPNDPGDYLIGEKLYPNNPGYYALRYMFKPSLDGASPDCYSADLGDLDVHYSSGVSNHFYYLLAEGAVVPEDFEQFGLTPGSLVCNGNTAITGIGRDAAQKIWYRALTVYMTSNTDYAGARAATIQSADDLYGAGSKQSKAVAAAWDAVSVM
ncbi:MAG: M4 family metallopeptidase [Luteimonas sp.]